jgi:hypothetical protein
MVLMVIGGVLITLTLILAVIIWCGGTEPVGKYKPRSERERERKEISMRARRESAAGDKKMRAELESRAGGAEALRARFRKV